MQSTGHSSMHDLSSTSTHGCAMMYVTSELLFRHPAGSGHSMACFQTALCDEGRTQARSFPPGGMAVGRGFRSLVLPEPLSRPRRERVAVSAHFCTNTHTYY